VTVTSSAPLFTHANALPYFLEIENVVDAALFRFQELEEAAQTWLTLSDELDKPARAAGDPRRAELFSTSTRMQSKIFDALEAFLAGYARLSLLLFPLAGRDASAEFRSQRGQHLRHRLGIREDSVLANRDFRDSWMHFDERLDASILRGHSGGLQRFIRSREVMPELREYVLRLVEVDLLVLSFRDRTGVLCSAELRSLRAALQEIEAAVRSVLRPSM
jgi:hypothetical protein